MGERGTRYGENKKTILISIISAFIESLERTICIVEYVKISYL